MHATYPVERHDAVANAQRLDAVRDHVDDARDLAADMHATQQCDETVREGGGQGPMLSFHG